MGEVVVRVAMIDSKIAILIWTSEHTHTLR